MQPLQIYNSLTKQKQIFKPIKEKEKEVGLYVCGVTVYDYCHIGHARTYLVFDMIYRYLQYIGYQVKYVRNITDIDDKIIVRAAEKKESIEQLTTRFIQAMHEDLHDKLNTLSPTLEPKATDFVPQMIALIKDLVDKGFAYVAENKDVYFEVEKFDSYGSLSHRDLDDLIAGSRVLVNEAKGNPLDFVLWKSAKPGEPAWESPWGLGRPGWHTECSAMSLELLGETFDIHCGGHDLKFPHHENERAQAEAVTKKPFVNVWMHAGFLQIDKEKMSKSTGNFITIREFLKDYHPEVLRYFNIASHYRSPVEYSTDNIIIAHNALLRLYTALRGIDSKKPELLDPEVARYSKKFTEAMNDDFNTPLALSILFDLARELNKHKEKEGDKHQAILLASLLKKLGNVLGILYSTPEEFLQDQQILSKEASTEIERLIEARNQARQHKDWALADKIRDELKDKGIELEDTPNKTLWRKS